MAKKKIYLSGNAKEVTFNDGASLFNVYVDLDDAREKGFVFRTKPTDSHPNGKEAIAFSMAKKQEVGQFGDTHYLYKIDPSESSATKTKEVPVKGASKPKKEEDSGDDLPF